MAGGSCHQVARNVGCTWAVMQDRCHGMKQGTVWGNVLGNDEPTPHNTLAGATDRKDSLNFVLSPSATQPSTKVESFEGERRGFSHG